MKTVKIEWAAAETDEQKLAWANKWADLLLETWNNPIWVHGYHSAITQVEDQIEQLQSGEYPDKLVTEHLEGYAKALRVINSTLNVISGTVEVPDKKPEELIDIALETIASFLAPYIEYDETNNTVSFNIVTVN